MSTSNATGNHVKVKFRRHADLIIEEAMETLFPEPPDPRPEWVEGYLAGIESALRAIGAEL